MGFLITEDQRQGVLDQGIDSVPETIMRVLSTNHARVLDWFRSMDTNFDGVISKGEFAYALHALGLEFAAKDVERVFHTLDPDQNGAVEFEELRRALLDKERWKRPPPPPRKSTAAERARQAHVAKVQRAELREDLYTFEKRHGLDADHDIWHEPPPNAQAELDRERKEVVLAEALERRRNLGGKAPLPKPIWHRMESMSLRQPAVRPDTTAARAAAAEAAARRKQGVYEAWLAQHLKEIESHALAVEEARAKDAAMREERTQAKRRLRLQALDRTRQAARQRALERHEIVETRRELRANRAELAARNRERAWKQGIVVVEKPSKLSMTESAPPLPAAPEPSAASDRAQHTREAEGYRIGADVRAPLPGGFRPPPAPPAALPAPTHRTAPAAPAAPTHRAAPRLPTSAAPGHRMAPCCPASSHRGGGSRVAWPSERAASAPRSLASHYVRGAQTVSACEPSIARGRAELGYDEEVQGVLELPAY